MNIFLSNSIDVGFYNFINSSLDIYLKDFFKQITILGDSKWYFFLSLFVIVFCYILKKISYYNNQKKIIGICNNFSILLFLSLIITGLLTQLLKHAVGRPRPKYTSLNGGVEFNFFNLNSEFHSFPSGHTSTIFVVALVTILFLPKLKYFFIILAGIVASSRIIMGAHFFTDIVGGITVAYLGVKLTKLFLDKRFPIKTNKKINLLFNKKFYKVYHLITWPALVRKGCTNVEI